MPAIIILKKELPRKHYFLFFLKSRYFVMGGAIDMNIGMF